MRQSRDSALQVLIAGRDFLAWEGESRLANADGVLDQLALAEAGTKPDVAAMLRRAAAKRVHGTRTVLVTTRRPGTPERAALEGIIAGESAADRLGGWDVLEADFAALESIFEYV
jgi:hypothetical protein